MQKFSSFLSWQKDKKIIWMVVADPKQGGSLTAFPHKSPPIADYIIGVRLFTQIWFTKVFISHTNTMRIEIHNITQSNSSPQSRISNGNGANGALLALSSCVIYHVISWFMMPIPVVTTTPLLTDAHSTGTGPEVARWIFSPKGAAKARFKKLAETDVDGGYNNGGSDGSCNSVSDRDDDGNGKDGGELVCDDHQWTRRRFLRHRPLICNAYRAGLCQHHHHHHHYRYLHLNHRQKRGFKYILWHCKICLSDLSFFSEKTAKFSRSQQWIFLL